MFQKGDLIQYVGTWDYLAGRIGIVKSPIESHSGFYNVYYFSETKYGNFQTYLLEIKLLSRKK